MIPDTESPYKDQPVQVKRTPIVTYTERPLVIKLIPPEEDIVKDPLTGAKKADRQKNRVDLLPTVPLEAIAEVLTFGATKYGDNNWRVGMSWMRLYGSTLRHLFAWARGETNDPESGLNHLAHAACNVLFLLDFAYHNRGTDDRYSV